MRLLSAFAIVVATLSLSTTYASAERWCADYGSQGGTNCGFHSYAQCQAAVSGVGGFCRRG
jgi:hypothetical protein